ncbi:M14 family zinc carboxypeptidase [Humibacillus xanthopallidus]|uniref:Zinc carboxypeptidase n=1 Tax=Humibacillus xanthopallidus TaxID=412689 RepID=A0A543I3F1_9MICO|nr:M14 family zinc carboxypeptidase [Humibacillus xanthopallidus]TQM65081.1 zinc carboxypeptidase [Humibacillus xanthopallidus]
MHGRGTAHPIRLAGGLTALALAAALLVTAPTAGAQAASPPGPAAVAAASVAPAASAEPCDPFTAPSLDASVPTARDVIGIDLGDRDVTTQESDAYLGAVADASPKVTQGVLATSVQGRPLRYAVVGQEKWVTPAGLERIGRDLGRLRDPKTPEAQASQTIRSMPSILWVAGNVHGGEESGTDAALRVLYELAARTDCAADEILDDAIVVVLPTQNPDGREADTRRNAYGFDMNRDWFARTQPETDGKVEMLRKLPPQLFIDAHEMGRATYFFPPNADPVYHDIGETPLDWIYNLYGPAMQEAFGRFSIPYFNGDVYDLFYMGYGDSVPATGFNAAGMTFEKSSGDPASQRVQEQYVAIWATLSAAGAKDDDLLTQWRAEHVKAYEQGVAGELEPNQLYWEGAPITNPVPDITVKHYFLRTDDPAKTEEVQRVVRRLQRMDVDVFRLVRPLTVPDYTPYGRPAASTTLPAGTYWIPMAQGQKHWVQAMLNEDTYVPFPYFYDVTAWSSPLLENIAGGRSGADLKPQAAPLALQAEPVTAVAGAAPRLGVWQISATSTGSIESAGWLRWWLDNRAGLKHTDLTAAQIAAGALADIDVLVVPNGSDSTASNALGAAGRAALDQWVRDGGRLITLRDSSRLATRLGLTSASYTSPTSDIPGSLIRVEVDPASPLSAGVGDTAWAMYEYEFVWSAAAGATPVRYPAAGDPDWFISGFAEGEEQLHGTSAVVDERVGDGRVVLFGFDPNYRAFTGGTARMLLNAITGPDPSASVQVGAAAPRSTAAVSASDRMVISVRPGAADRVQALLAARGASADVVRSPGVVSFRVDLGGRTADEHPWAQEVALDAAKLGPQVVAIRLP